MNERPLHASPPSWWGDRPGWPPGRIAIIMMSAIGDAVHVLPIVNLLKRTLPETRITWVIQPGPHRLVEGHPAVDRFILFSRRGGLGAIRSYLEIAPPLRARRFDLLLALQVYFKAGLITGLAPAAVKLGFDRARARDLNWLVTNRRIPARPPQHVLDQYLEFLEYLGMPTDPVTWNIGPWDHEREWQRSFLSRVDRRVAALVIGSSRPEKDWPADRWAQVVDLLDREYDLEPVLVGGRSPAELRTERKIMARARRRPLSTLGISMRQLVAVLDGAQVVITVDTGPMHVAVALNRPVIALMGYNNPKRVGPYRRFHDLLVDAYGDPGEEYLASPAHRQGRMTRIQVADVAAKLELWAERYGPGSIR